MRACASVRLKARMIPIRSPAFRAMSSRSAVVVESGGVWSGPVACSTPTVLPAMLTGTHTAEQSPVSRSRRWGHVSIAVLEGQVWVWPRLVAGQSSGDMTGQPGPPSGSVVMTCWK